MAQPTLGRQVEGLEQELGTLLFERLGKRLVLTEAGMSLLEHVRVMGDAASRVSLAASGHAQSLEGSITITASDMFAAHVLPPIVARLRREEPGIDVEIVAANAPSDLRRREADIAIRNFRPVEADLVAKKVRDMAGYLYAASTYLDALGRPTTPADFATADFIGFNRGEAMTDLLVRLGFPITAKNLRIVSENQIVQWAMVKVGLGIGVNAAVIGDAEPGVERIFPALEPVMFPVWLVSHRELHTSRRVRRVFDLLAEELARLPG